MSAAIVGAYGPMLGPGFVPISAQLGITVEVLSQATAWLILTLGLCVFFMNPLAKIYGKRPVYVFASVVLFIVSVWVRIIPAQNSLALLTCQCRAQLPIHMAASSEVCASSITMNQVRANSTRLSTGRILGALGMAPYEVLVQATISDLYFVHQRGTRIAVWNLFLLCGICGAGFISGYIIEDLGYKWTFGVCAILFGIFGIGILFFVPETNYIRNEVTSKILAKTGIQHQERGAEDEKFDEKGMHVEAHSIALPTILTGNGSNPDAATESKMSYMKSLRLYTGRYTDAPVWKIFARPFVMFFYPCVIWAFLIYGTTLTWIVYV